MPAFGLTAAERVLPKMALDFTTASLDSRVTITRALNTATAVNSSGYIAVVNANLPRFDYSPTTLACKGLLIEESRANLLLQSADFGNASWTKVASSISADVVVSPDGTQNADKLIEGTTNSAHYPVQAPTVAATTSYVMSAFLKAAERTKSTYIFENSGKFAGVVFDLSKGTADTPFGTLSGTTAGVDAYGNGWYRCWMKITTEAGTTSQVQYRLNNGSTDIYTGNGTSGFYIWGAQLEAGAFATSYIPTITTSLTRNADTVTMTGTNFSSWWQLGSGGALVQVIPSTVIGTRPLVQFDDGTPNEIIELRGNSANPELYIVDGGSLQAQIDAGTIAANTPYSLTGWWQTNFCAARKDNDNRVEDLTATIPTVTQARIGSDGVNYLNGHIATINYYDMFSDQIYTRRKNKVIFTVI